MIEIKTPLTASWAPIRLPAWLRGLARRDTRGWRRKGLTVFSSVAMMEAPDGSGDHLETWLVSVSRTGASMPSDRDLARVRRDFGMAQAEEDNHESGNARKLFLVVDPARRVACECKTDETVVTRPDGYRYSVKREDGPR